MSKLRKEFSKKDWKHCCGSFCKTCEIACAYREKFGNKKGYKKHQEDWTKYNR